MTNGNVTATIQDARNRCFASVSPDISSSLIYVLLFVVGSSHWHVISISMCARMRAAQRFVYIYLYILFHFNFKCLPNVYTLMRSRSGISRRTALSTSHIVTHQRLETIAQPTRLERFGGFRPVLFHKALVL